MGTKGLDDLQARCRKYYENGARFAKWRNVLKISKDGNPSEAAIFDCTMTLAKYATICQLEGLVPIVEPEVMLDGDHDIETAFQVLIFPRKFQREWHNSLLTLYSRQYLLRCLASRSSVVASQRRRPRYTSMK